MNHIEAAMRFSLTRESVTPAILRALVIPLCLGACLGGCRQTQPDLYQGYAEGEYVLISAPTGGRLTSLTAEEGATVSKGQRLFSLEAEPYQARVEEAEHRLVQARAELEDLRKGARPTEIDALRAKLKQAQAALQLSRKEYRRRLDLAESEAISRDEVDRAETAMQKDRQEVRRLEAKLATARLGGRQDRIEAAEARVASARAALEQARWELRERTQKAPAGGLVFETFYEPGERVGPGQPVVSILPPGSISVVFFVPQAVSGRLAPGDRTLVTWDSGGRLTARVSYISPEPEYTPPIIYSSRSRAKLVFKLEAKPLEPQAAKRLHPGQPVDVRLIASGSDHG